MKLVKINDVIVNMDKVKTIMGLNSSNEERGKYVVV
jgi:hypothetical protein